MPGLSNFNIGKKNSLVQFIKNKNRACQGIPRQYVTNVIHDILSGKNLNFERRKDVYGKSRSDLYRCPFRNKGQNLDFQSGSMKVFLWL